MVRIARQFLGFGTAAAILVVATGCDRDSGTAAALREARQQLTALHAGAFSPQDPALRKTQYERTIQSLEGVSGQGTDGQQASANLLLGTAHAALAQIEASETLDLEHDAATRLGLIKSQFEHLVVSMQQSAQIMTSVDSSSDQRDLEKHRQSLQSKHQSATVRVSEMESRINTLAQDSQVAHDGANEFRAQEGILRSQMLQATGQQRADLTVAAVGAQRKADAFDLQQATALTQMDLLEPQIDQLRQDVLRIETQLANLSSTQQQMQALDAIRQQSATDALQIAQSASDDITRALIAHDTFRTSELKSAYDNTLSRFDRAMNELRRASNDSDLRSSTQITMGSLSQTKAELLERRAAAFAVYAMLLETMSDPAYNLSNAQQLQQYAARARGSLAQTQTDITQATNAAIASYRDARVQGEARGQIERLIDRLESSIETP